MAIKDALHALLRRLSLIAIGVTAGHAPAAAAELRDIPPRTIEAVIDESEGDDWDDADRLQVLRLLTHDPRPAVRRHVALSLAVRAPADGEQGETLVAALVTDASRDVRALARADLVALLERLPALARTDLVCRWAVDGDAHKRAAVAAALAAPMEVLGARTALEHLGGDEVGEVRELAQRALARGRRG
jgi:hypothetical protein